MSAQAACPPAPRATASAPAWPALQAATARLAAFGPLVAIVALQAVASLSLRNTAFQDEALYLYAGRQIIDHFQGGPAPIENFAAFFSGLPYAYPVVAGLLDAALGLEGARLLSLVCMLGTTSAVYVLGRRLFERNSGLLGAVLFAVQGSVLFIGRLATYDALCLVLLAMAAVVAVCVGSSRRLAAAALVGILLTLAVVAKYAGLLFVPSVVALLGWYSLKACGWRRAVIHVAVAAVVPAVSLALALALAPDLVAGVQVTTTQRVIVEPISRLDLLSLAAHQTGLVLALGLMGLALGLAGKGARVPAVVLVGSALLPIAYHLYTTEFTSFQKHLAFSSLFIAPLAGYATARMAGSAHDAWLGSGWPSALAVCLLAFGLGLPQAQSLYGIWPDSSAMVRLLRTQVHAGSSQILAEEAEVPRYYLQDIAGAAQWHNLYWFQYTDAVGQELTGEAAYRAAIADGYFDLIVLRFGPNADLARTLAAQVQDDPRYEAFVWPASESSAYTVWRKRSA